MAVLEPRSNTMKLGVHREQLAPVAGVGRSPLVLEFGGSGLGSAGSVALGVVARFGDSVDELVQRLAAGARPGDHILVMSNGGFGGLHEKLLAALRARA